MELEFTKPPLTMEVIHVCSDPGEWEKFTIQWKKGKKVVAKITVYEDGLLELLQGKNFLQIGSLGTSRTKGIFAQRRGKKETSTVYLNFK
jgi:hypothetical protein